MLEASRILLLSKLSEDLIERVPIRQLRFLIVLLCLFFAFEIQVVAKLALCSTLDYVQRCARLGLTGLPPKAPFLCMRA